MVQQGDFALTGKARFLADRRQPVQSDAEGDDALHDAIAVEDRRRIGDDRFLQRRRHQIAAERLRLGCDDGLEPFAL